MSERWHSDLKRVESLCRKIELLIFFFKSKISFIIEGIFAPTTDNFSTCSNDDFNSNILVLHKNIYGQPPPPKSQKQYITECVRIGWSTFVKMLSNSLVASCFFSTIVYNWYNISNPTQYYPRYFSKKEILFSFLGLNARTLLCPVILHLLIRKRRHLV